MALTCVILGETVKHQSLQGRQVRAVQRVPAVGPPLVVDIWQEGVGRQVLGKPQRVLEVLRLHDMIPDERQVRAAAQQLLHHVAGPVAGVERQRPESTPACSW